MTLPHKVTLKVFRFYTQFADFIIMCTLNGPLILPLPLVIKYDQVSKPTTLPVLNPLRNFEFLLYTMKRIAVLWEMFTQFLKQFLSSYSVIGTG